MHDSLSMDQVFIKNLTEIVKSNLANEDFDIEKLTSESGMSRSKIQRKLRAIKNKSVNQFIRELRLEEARRLLLGNMGTVSEIAYRVGFGSPTYFSKCYHEFYGYAPGEIRKTNSEVLEIIGEDYRERVLPLREINKKFRLFPTAILSVLVIAILLFIFIFDGFSLLKGSEDEIIAPDGKIPITVLPFRNNTGDTSFDIWQDWIKDNLVTYLSNYPDELIVRQEESIFNIIEVNNPANYASINSPVIKYLLKNIR